jgi:hypothetical protein
MITRPRYRMEPRYTRGTHGYGDLIKINTMRLQRPVLIKANKQYHNNRGNIKGAVDYFGANVWYLYIGTRVGYNIILKRWTLLSARVVYKPLYLQTFVYYPRESTKIPSSYITIRFIFNISPCPYPMFILNIHFTDNNFSDLFILCNFTYLLLQDSAENNNYIV